MSRQNFNPCWSIAGGIAFVAMFVVGYRTEPKHLTTAAASGEISPAEHRTPEVVTVDELAGFGRGRVFSFPLYLRLQSMDEWQVFELAMQFTSAAEAYMFSYDGRFQALVRRLAEASPDKVMALCLSLDGEHAATRARALEIAGSVLGMNLPERVLSFLPDAPQDRIDFLKGVVEGIPESALDTLTAHLESEASPELRKRLNERLAGPSLLSIALTDPDHAATRIRDIEDEGERRQTFSRLLQELGSVDFPKAIRLLLSNEDFEWGYDLPVVGAFRQDPRATLSELLKLRSSTARDKSLALLLEAPTGVSVAVANQVAAEIADAGVRQNAVLEFAKRLGETDEAAAIEFAGQHGTQVELEESLAAIKLSQLARNKPLDALSAAAKLGGDVEMILAQVSYRLDGFEREVIDIVEPTPDAPHSEALSNLLRTWATRDPEAALAAVSDDRLKAYRGEIWSSAAGTQPLETIEAALEAGDANVAKVAIETGIIALAREDSATALAVFGTVIEDPVHTSLLSSRIVEKVASALVRDVSIQDALSWTTTLPERLSKPAMRSVFDTGMQQDFGVVSDLVHRLPPGAARNQGMLRIATATIEADPVFAFDTLLQVPEADREKRHFDQLFKFWREIDSGAANAAAASVGITR